jgi:hypothetical protein
MKAHLIIFAALLIIPLFCAASYVREVIAVDSVLDSGASFDYATGRADHSVSHPYIPFSHRHQTLLVLSGVSFATAVLYGSVIMSARLRSRAI